jgi:uncharacterized protein YecA (UPF0149 family)
MGFLENILGKKKMMPPDVLPGRNDSCWCGSNIKYKKCHIEEDRKVILDKKVCCTGST